mmetsp:Transcript_45056/g.107056  ORF Transcript_45056/g.107056 Transcript_45056/m.107056 type:complete len:100 (+) Transcript_45056:1191-1490(+)
MSNASSQSLRRAASIIACERQVFRDDELWMWAQKADDLRTSKAAALCRALRCVGPPDHPLWRLLQAPMTLTRLRLADAMLLSGNGCLNPSTNMSHLLSM